MFYQETRNSVYIERDHFHRIFNYYAILSFLIQIYIERVVCKTLLVSHGID